ncbi:DNA ligase LigA-related protein [Lysinibacillus sp. NPDC093692]|uniref:DNA ligase LigA-related protein n=1 Tax=Lysinibacillus sp. NPDC093692 TaxID=3390578 RepID=UPI003D03C9F6
MTKEITLFDQLQSSEERFNYPVMKAIFHYHSDNVTKQTEALLVVNVVQHETALSIANAFVHHGLLKGLDLSNDNYSINKLESLELNLISTDDYISTLQNTIIVHDKLYEQNRPIITGSMYDGLYKELIRLEAAYPRSVNSNSPTQRMIANFAESLEKVSHS